jgi:hypothetical protein
MGAWGYKEENTNRADKMSQVEENYNSDSMTVT